MAEEAAAPAASPAPAPMSGGVTSSDEAVNTPHDVFATSGSEPVRDKTPDPSKGQPVTRWFTKDGTPVEPSSINTVGAPFALKGTDGTTRSDVVAATEYVDEGGSPVTHDSLAASKDATKAPDKAASATGPSA